MFVLVHLQAESPHLESEAWGDGAGAWLPAATRASSAKRGSVELGEYLCLLITCAPVASEGSFHHHDHRPLCGATASTCAISIAIIEMSVDKYALKWSYGPRCVWFSYLSLVKQASEENHKNRTANGRLAGYFSGVYI